MARLLEGQDVQELHEGDTLVHDVHVIEQAPLTVPEEWMRDHGTTTQERRRPIRWMRWLAVFGLLAAGAGVAVVATLGDDNETVAQPEPVSAPIVRTVDRWELGLSPTVVPVVPRTVDNWELGLNPPTVLVMPQAMTPEIAPEGDWDHLFLNLVAPATPVVEGDWDHLLLDPVAPATPVVSLEHEWDHLLLPPTSHRSFEVAEANRMMALQDLPAVSDGSFEVAEANRMGALQVSAPIVSLEHEWDHLLLPVTSDGSFEVAEANRMGALQDLTTVSDGSFEVAEANRMGALQDLTTVSDGSFEVAEANRMAALNDPTTG